MEETKIHRLFYLVSLIQKYRDGALTDTEMEVLQSWLKESSKNEELFDEVIDSGNLKEFEDAYLSIDTTVALEVFKQKHGMPHQKSNTTHILLRRLMYVAALLVFAMTVVWYLVETPSQTPITTVEVQHLDVQPGGNRATLTFADGKSIDLSEAQDGIVIGNGTIAYQDGETEVADIHNHKVDQLMLATPKGGMYSVTMSDGTTVWLNAESRLKYPSRFSKEARVVELEGEAYFDVARRDIKGSNDSDNRLWPFIVVSKGQRIEVLGTKFNVSVYGNQAELKTTLVEGSVRLVAEKNNQPTSVILKPGQQGVISDQTLTIGVKTVDSENLVAWKDGYFYFNNTPTEELMKEVARWYDIEVVYRGSVPNDTFSGKVKRNTTLMGLLEILQMSTINVKLEDNKLIIN